MIHNLIDQLHYKRLTQSGQSLVEALIALSVFVVGVATIGFLVLDASVASRQGLERTQATLFAQEGLEAVRSIRDGDFDNLAVGTHGLALVGNVWTFSGTSDTQDQFTRQVVVSNVPGVLDDDSDIKKIQSTVTWQVTQVRQSSVTYVSYLTDWNQTHGQAGDLKVDISGVYIAAADRELRGITIQNIGTSTTTIAKMTVWWDLASRLRQIQIGDVAVFNVPPFLGVPSGTNVDITDFVLPPAAGVVPINKFKFTDPIEGTDFMIKFKMIDGSTKYTFVDF